MSRIPIPKLPNNPLLGNTMRPLNEAMRQVAELSNLTGVGGQMVSRYPSGTSFYDAASNLQTVSFLAVVVDEGPNRDQDYTDSRYWVRSITAAQIQNAVSTDPIDFYLDPVTIDGEETQQDGLWLTASNLAELNTQTHTLTEIPSDTTSDSPLNSTACTFVRVTQIAALKVDPATNDYANLVFVFETITAESAISGSFLIEVYVTKVGGSDGDGVTAATWTYDVYSDPGHTALMASAQSVQFTRITAASNTPGTHGIWNDSTGTLMYVDESYPLDSCPGFSMGTF